MLCASCRIIKKPDEIAYVVLNILSFRCRPVKHIEQFEVKAETISPHYNIISVEITVIVMKVMDLFDAHYQCMKQVYSLKRAQAPAEVPTNQTTKVGSPRTRRAGPSIEAQEADSIQMDDSGSLSRMRASAFQEAKVECLPDASARPRRYE